MFEKILIANRGEIACRVIKTAKRLGIKTVAVYSEADADARHVEMADEAHLIGPAPARESYLNIEMVLEAARQSGVDAIHPGYGFLSENAGFAEACKAAGFIFIGPPVKAIEAMGSKSAAKKIMEAAKVPLVPGFHGEEQDLKTLQMEAEKIGFPVLLKASAGGGGKGMRVVESVFQLKDAVEAAKREAASAFGDDHMLIEKYLARPRHVEVQVFADAHGNAVHLFERDCSIQRRHQKVVEEAPAPGLDPAIRKKMGDAAVAAAQAIGYQGAGTVEFLLDEDGSFYFMEMNTRLQVEHPITEMITSQDLVEWQLRVAAGQHLPLSQDDLCIDGHAIEVRIYAEDPSREFLPATGRLRHLRTPAEGPHLRIDTGVVEGDEVSIHYDPMIAKLIVWDATRSAAVRRLRAALAEYQVVGVTTNVEFLAAIAGHKAYANGELDTRFIERHRGDLIPEVRKANNEVLALAALDVLLRRSEEAVEHAADSYDPFSPWHRTDGWRLNDDNHHEITFLDGDDEVEVTVHFRAQGFEIEHSGYTVLASGECDANGDLIADLGGHRMKATVARNGRELTILRDGRAHRLVVVDKTADAGAGQIGSGRMVAPMPGKVVAVMTEAGQKVEAGTSLMVLEAMKMEHTIKAPSDGTVKEVFFAVGDQVDDGTELVAFEPEED